MTSPKYEEDTILQGKVFSPLVRFAIPLMLSILLQTLYGAVDLIVVGKFGDTTGVSAVANGSQIMQSVTEVIAGLTVGITVLVGRFIGARDEEGAADIVSGMIRLFLIIGLITTAVIVIPAPLIVRLMKVPAEAADKSVAYIRICGSGFLFITAFNVISGLFRGIGNSHSPLLFMAIACVTNIVGDLLLCGVFKLDVAGAAAATVFAQAVSVGFSIYKIKKDGLPFKINKIDLRRAKSSSINILKVGGPVSLENLLIGFSFLIIIAIVNSLGLAASASIGISEKLFTFLALVPLSFMYALAAFVAQNVGAKQEERAIRGLRVAMLVSFVYGVLMFCLTFFKGDFLASIFENDPAVIIAAKSYLRGISAEYLLVPLVLCFLGYFNGVGKTTFVMLQGLISSFAVRIPLSYFLSRIPDASLSTIGLAVPLSTFSSLLMCGGYYIFVRRKRLEIGEL